ncbi:MAG: NusA N-terminal domain-containing protein, partial [Promethearchaeota archaeon]
MPFIKDIRPSIKGNMENYPQILVFGQFKLHIEQYTAAGRYSEATGMIEGVSGYAWLNYDLEDVSGSFFPSLDLQGYQNIYNILEVVSSVKNPQTEISIDEAKRFKPNISVGDNLELKFSVDHDRFKKIIKEEMNFTKTLKELYMKNKILLFFENITIQKSNPDVTNPLIIDHPIIGNVIYGKAVYPHHRAFPPITAIIINDFTIQIHEIELTTTEARANLAIRLPNCIGERYRCTPATVDIGWVIIDNNFEFYVERNEKYGPWIIGETGLIVYGEKLIVDFSSSKSPSFINPSFKGIYLLEGKVSGRELNPKESNTGYLAGDYHFDYAIITPEGFTGNIQLDKDFSFNPINPTGYKINIINGQLDIFNCSIKGGHFGPGNVELPKKAILEESTNDCFIADFTDIRVYDNLDLFGEKLFKSHSLASWGDLTNPVDLKKHWNISMNRGYIYLPAGSISTFYPISGNQYISLDLSINAYAELASKHVAGITTVGIEVIAFFSPDSEHGLIDFPIKFIEVEGWINIGHSGIHGSLVSQMQYPRRLGNVNRVGYIANTSFDNTFNTQDRRSLIGEFVMSSVYNSDIKGELFIPNPCQMILNYDKMKLTSTVNIVGGDITLPSNGVTLDYWKLQLEPQTGQSVAGYLSIRTGVIAMTAASLSERIHFEKPFPLIWAEIHADGNIKDFIFDYSTDGQKFDKFPFVPAHIELSEYVPDKFDCYIAVCGTVHFNVFGGYYIAVRDARYDPNTGAPHFNRYVSLPKNFKEACKPTNLELYTEWANQVLKLHFPNDQMRYNEDTQNGFNGEGTIDVSVLIGTLSAN